VAGALISSAARWLACRVQLSLRAKSGPCDAMINRPASERAQAKQRANSWALRSSQCGEVGRQRALGGRLSAPLSALMLLLLPPPPPPIGSPLEAASLLPAAQTRRGPPRAPPTRQSTPLSAKHSSPSSLLSQRAKTASVSIPPLRPRGPLVLSRTQPRAQGSAPRRMANWMSASRAERESSSSST